MVSPSTDKAPSIVELTPETYQQDVSSDSIDLESGTKKLQNESALQSHEYTTNIDETSSSNTASKLTYIQKLKIRFPYYRLAIDIFIGCFFTAWWLSIVIQPKHRHQWLIPTVIWGMIMVRLITWHIKILPWLLNKVKIVWDFFTGYVYKVLSKKYQRLITGAVITVGVILLGTFVPSETEYSKRKDRAISFFGCIVAIFLLFVTSKAPSKINWNAVIGGMLMQFIIALFVLRTKCGYDVFNFISTLARELLGFAKDGVAFLTNKDVSQLGMFFFTVLPSVAFFVAFIHIWYYFGVIQWAIRKFAYFFFWTLRVSGAEAITAAASPFIGIGESAILIKDLMPYLTKAELHQIMTSGFSTISGAVLVGYIGLGLNPQALVSSCVMSIPASLAVSKLRYPELENPISSGTVMIPKVEDPEEAREKSKDEPQNVLQAFSNGATLGLRIAGTMMIQCMCIIGLVALCNGILTWFGNYWNIDHLTLELMLSYIFYPIGFLLGTPRNEILLVSKLIAYKFIQNEYVAYNLLTNEAPYNEMSKRGTLIATYACCGFANLGSLGITLGVLNTLTNNSRAKDISSSIISALFCGAIATMLSAAIAGMVMHDLNTFHIN
ncbi:NupC family nucleoside transporter [Candida albicans P57072]|uniref:Cntp n=2 Tax=Candida albicans TaxID=5476 RepID=A0A1D8PHJ7_CANAL|nr:Cntp [Candida albicans SC5314]KGR12356.1 NupC family nucleoside transporter [Candida albicans P57072]KGR13591.1 NupC family nucleoside transporter [Candida albicans P78048]KGU11711.1 NupC family nucleoside transporter [Candida albicans P87]KGU32695.1 NupC family nucleoside transporter [Candida albicans P75063]KHC58617.1 NupC family nucleoside transporter [Candida albicans P37039]KHC72498.1 NupC family nucleoside transporter [Candida albicans P75016]|eukprot:XP_714288.1 Cntp [Candida albicans SC5314]